MLISRLLKTNTNNMFRAQFRGSAHRKQESTLTITPNIWRYTSRVLNYAKVGHQPTSKLWRSRGIDVPLIFAIEVYVHVYVMYIIIWVYMSSWHVLYPMISLTMRVKTGHQYTHKTGNSSLTSSVFHRLVETRMLPVCARTPCIIGIIHLHS